MRSSLRNIATSLLLYISCCSSKCQECAFSGPVGCALTCVYDRQPCSSAPALDVQRRHQARDAAAGKTLAVFFCSVGGLPMATGVSNHNRAPNSPLRLRPVRSVPRLCMPSLNSDLFLLVARGIVCLQTAAVREARALASGCVILPTLNRTVSMQARRVDEPHAHHRGAMPMRG